MTPSAEFWLASADGLRVACARWDERGSVRGVLQLADQPRRGAGTRARLGLCSAGRTEGWPGAAEAIREEPWNDAAAGRRQGR
jgi:hypothetical protein